MDAADPVGRTPEPLSDGLVERAALYTTDLDEARAFCRQMFYDTLRVRPLGDADGLDFAAGGVRLGPVTLAEVRYGADVSVTTSDLESAYHVLVPVTGLVICRQGDRKMIADPLRAAVFQPVGDVELGWDASCRLLSVKVDRRALEREVDAALERQLPSPLPLGSTFDLASGPGRSWAALVRLLLAELRDADGLLHHPPMLNRWRDLVLSGLALTVEHPYGTEPAARRPRTVKRTLDAMHAQPAHPYTVAELAGIAGVGVRVLQESFRRHVGMSPLTYLRRLRLDGVHAELRRSDPWQVSVSEVAARWGFTHLGRFAGA
jgi:AraC-like DNA-binding protein